MEACSEQHPFWTRLTSRKRRNSHLCFRGSRLKLYTIGFTQKSAETFFELLRRNGVRRLVDIRVSPDGQLSGFARKTDLPYFLSRLADGCGYIHLPELAPTKDTLHEYRADHDWPRYVERFEALMDERNIPAALNREEFEAAAS